MDLYTQLGRWHPTEELARALKLAVLGDSNQLPAAASLAKVFGGSREVGDWLKTLAHESVNPRVTAAALDALNRGWSSTSGLDAWLQEAEQSPSVELRAVAALALHRRGRRGDEGRDSLLSALDSRWDRFSSRLHAEIMDALVADWADDGELRDACWAGVGRLGPPKHDIQRDYAQTMLLRLHREDPRVACWVQEEIEKHDHFPFRGTQPGITLLEPILSEHANVRAAVEALLEKNEFVGRGHEAAWLAAMLRSDVAKRAMLSLLAKTGEFRFWPVWSLLHGWGIDDPQVAAAMEPLPRITPEERQHIAHLVPEIVGSTDESFRLLIEVCHLPQVKRTDFVIRGFAALGNQLDKGKAVSAVLPHVKKSPSRFLGEEGLIAGFPTDPRVREFALERLQGPTPPLAAIAIAYEDDEEIASLVLQRAAPLPKVFRRYIAKRASQRFDDEPLMRVLRECALEEDNHAMTQATIGHSYAALAAPGEVEARSDVLRAQLHAVGPHFDQQTVAAFGGLLALGQIDVFAGAKERHNNEPLGIHLVDRFEDYTPVLELTAERWEELESATGGSSVSRLSRWNDHPSGFWRTFAPYVSRSPLLRSRFVEYCADESVMPKRPVWWRCHGSDPAARCCWIAASGF